MSFLWLVHSDPGLRRALSTTLQTLWPELSCSLFAPEEIPAMVPEDCIVVAPTSPPQRINAIIEDIQKRIRQSAFPSLLHFDTPTGHKILNTRTREWDSAQVLTEKEVEVLTYLWQRRLAATREDLLRDVWNYAADTDTHTIETHIYRLRQKIELNPAAPEFLVTTKDGYQLALRSSA